MLFTLIAESSYTNSIDITPANVVEFKNNQSSIEFTLPKTTDYQAAQSKYLYTFPKKIKSTQELSVLSFFNESNYILDKDTELEVLIAKDQEKRLHTKLISGTLILDTRLAKHSIQTIQVGNTFLKPFTNGIYIVSNLDGQIRLGAIQGSFSLGIYDQTGQLSNTLLIHRYQEVSYKGLLPIDTSAVSSLSSQRLIDTFRFSKFQNISEDISKSELFKLSFKGKSYTPDSDKVFTAKLNSLNFNQNKKNFLNIYPFYSSLDNSKKDILSNQSESLAEHLSEARTNYLDIVTNKPESLELLNQTANQNLDLLVGLSPTSNLNSLKIFLADLFSKDLNQDTSLKVALSLLEDINYGYDNRKPDISVRSEQVLSKVVSSPALANNNISDLTSLLVVLDNILETFDQSFSIEILQARETIISLISTKANDPELLNQIQARKLNYFQKVIDLAQEGKIEIAKAKRVAFFITDTLPEDIQQQYRNQINQLD